MLHFKAGHSTSLGKTLGKFWGKDGKVHDVKPIEDLGSIPVSHDTEFKDHPIHRLFPS
jgi:hypothetical protein